jgi:hypothetical protein
VIGFGDGLRAVLIVAVIALPLAAVALARRRTAALVFVGVFVAVSAAFAARVADDQARAVAATAMLPANRSWVDAAVGKGTNVTLLNTSNFMPETVRREIFPIFAPWWETQFWNRSARTVDSLGSPEPLPLAQGWGTLDWATGVVSGVPPAAALLVDPRFEIAGRRRGASAALVLYDRVSAPIRLVSATEGVFRDGESSAYAAYDRWGHGAHTVRIAIARPEGSDPIRVHVRVGSLTSNGPGPAMGRVTATRDVELRSGTITMPVPTAPFRVEVRYDPGIRGTVRFTPTG